MVEAGPDRRSPPSLCDVLLDTGSGLQAGVGLEEIQAAPIGRAHWMQV